jgi:hypothetical protein
MEDFLDQEFPTFLDLVVEVGRLEIDPEFPKIYQNQNGEPFSPMDHISYTGLQDLFYRYLLHIQGKKATNSQVEIDELWSNKYFTIRHLTDAFSQSKVEVKTLQNSKKIRSDLAKKDLRKKSLVHSNFSGPQRAFIIFYEQFGAPIKKGNESLYEDYRIWSFRLNRVKSDLETNQKRIRLFERMICELSPDAQIRAEREYLELRQNIKNEEDKLS